MGKLKWILVIGALLAAVSATAVAGSGPTTGAVAFSSHDVTTSQSAVLLAYLAVLPDPSGPGLGANTAISVSNTLGTPSGSGFPQGGDTEGPVVFYCWDRDSANGPLMFSTADHPDVGTGVDVGGALAPGGTYTVNMDQVLTAAGAQTTFVGYCYVVGYFDAIAGTYTNFFFAINSQQSFPAQPADFDGEGVTLQ